MPVSVCLMRGQVGLFEVGVGDGSVALGHAGGGR